jgi:MFS transporter, OFA family, oxalate/formate antiporter
MSELPDRSPSVLPLHGNGTAPPSGSHGIYYGYWLIGIAFVAQFVAVGSFNYVAGPFMTPMIDELGWTRAEYTIPRTAGQVVMALIGLFIGTQVDRHGGKRLMLVGTTVLVGAMFATAHVTALWEWIALNGLMLTVGVAMIGNLVVNVTLSKWFVLKRGRAVAISAMGVSFAGVLLVPATTWAIDLWGWRMAWQMLAVGAAVLMYPVALLMRRAPEDYGLYPDGLTAAQLQAGLGARASDDFASSLTRGQALRTWSFYLIVIAFGLFVINIGVMLLQTVPFMTDAGFSRLTAALMITVASVPSLLSKPLWGYFIDRVDAKPLAAAGAAITGIALFVIVAAVAAGSLPWAWFGFFVLGIGWGGMIPLQEVIWANFFGRRYLGAVRSAALPFSLAIGASAPLLTSLYYDVVGNYHGALLTVALLNVLSALMIYLIPKPRRVVAS